MVVLFTVFSLLYGTNCFRFSYCSMARPRNRVDNVTVVPLNIALSRSLPKISVSLAGGNDSREGGGQPATAKATPTLTPTTKPRVFPMSFPFLSFFHWVAW